MNICMLEIVMVTMSFHVFRTSEDTKSASQDNLDGKASEKVSFRLNLRKQIILKNGICNILNTCSVIVSNFYFAIFKGIMNWLFKFYYFVV